MIPFDRSSYDAYIFDCDGTLADTMPMHYVAWTETLTRKLGRPSIEYTEALFYHFGGMPARHIIEKLNADYGYGLDPESTAVEKEERFVELLHRVGPVPEVVEVLNSLPAGTKIAVASGGQAWIVRDTLKFIGLEAGPGHRIQVIVGSDQVKLGKPNPDLFLHTAEVLGAKPARCLVFEDAEPGFKAATAAGMDYIDVRKYRATIAAAARY